MDTGRNQEIPVVGPYFLISFAPSSGIGIYEFKDVTHRFDSIPGRKDRTGKGFDAGGQVDAGIYFNSFDELLAFCRREYLRDKKNSYYATLFTRQVGKTVCAKALKFLNEPRLSGINVSRVVISLLKEVADAERVVAVMLQAHELQLINVGACLATDFTEIIFSQATTETLTKTSEEAERIIGRLKEYANHGPVGHVVSTAEGC